MTDREDGGTQRVTNALLRRDIEELKRDVVEIKDMLREHIEKQEQANQEFRERLAAHETEIARLKDKQGMDAWLNRLLSLALASAAAWLGARQP
jgi:predicted nuclease with TOPRIM domain